MKQNVTLLALILVLNFNIFAQKQSFDLVYNPDVEGIENNPMKGLMPGSKINNSNFPHSVDFFYIPLKGTYLDWNVYDWTALDKELDRITSLGCHSVFRFYIDYPRWEYVMPEFLQKVVPSKEYSSYKNDSETQSKIPDWNSETLIKALELFIAALGTRYDGDPRILMIEAGLYGFWGEWHTHTQKGAEMVQQNKDRLIIAYSQAFKKTHIALRQAFHPSTVEMAMSVGYYDDSFCYSTIAMDGQWCYWYNFVKRGITDNYKYHPMGGEVRPEIMAELFNEWPNKVGEDVTQCVTTTHISFVRIAHFFRQQPTSTQYNNGMKMHKMMGYQLYVRSANIKSTSRHSFEVSVNIQNRGVAPVYYNWEVEFSAIDHLGKWITPIGVADWNITGIIPDGKDYPRTFKGVLPAKGRYTILMRLKNPLENYNSKARVLRFANGNQDKDKLGWLTLGDVTISH